MTDDGQPNQPVCVGFALLAAEDLVHELDERVSLCLVGECRGQIRTRVAQPVAVETTRAILDAESGGQLPQITKVCCGEAHRVTRSKV